MAPTERDVGASPHEDLEAKELHEAVNKAVQHLTPSERRLFEMRQIEGLELDVIAKQTNIAKPSIKSIVSAARKKEVKDMTYNQTELLIQKYLNGETSTEEERLLALEVSQEDAPLEWKMIAECLAN